MGGQIASDKLVRPAAVCSGDEAEISRCEEVEATALHGVEEREDRMSEEEGDGVEGVGRAGPTRLACESGTSKQTNAEGEGRTHSNAPVVQRLAHTLHEGQRLHHITKQEGEDQLLTSCNKNSVVDAPNNTKGTRRTS